MKIFHDWEFLEDGSTIDWISVGMRREDGAELYLINRDLCYPQSSLHQRVSAHPWLMANVVPHLPLRALVRPSAETWMVDPDDPAVAAHTSAAEQIKAFILEVVVMRHEPELWAWYGAYDHVRLAQMFGPMAKLPQGIPMVTHDIVTLARFAGNDARRTAPVQQGDAHHALADARHNEKLHAHYLEAALDRLEKRTG